MAFKGYHTNIKKSDRHLAYPAVVSYGNDAFIYLTPVSERVFVTFSSYDDRENCL